MINTQLAPKRANFLGLIAYSGRITADAQKETKTV